jgi:MYXO-CTERM domain-containing protein
VLPDGGMETMCEPAPPPTVIRQCMPPYADYIGRYYGSDGSTSNTGTLTGALPPQGQIGAPTGAPGPTPAPGGEATGTPKSSGSTPSASSGDTGGCQVGHGNTGTGASLLALFGLVGLARRRRASATRGR